MRTSKDIIDSLVKARDRAQSPDFKLLWELKRLQYIRSITPKVPAGGDLLNGWPEDVAPDYDTV